MTTLLVSDKPTISQRILKVLGVDGVDCPDACVVPFDQAEARLAQAGVGLIVVVLPGEPGPAAEALEAFERVPQLAGTRIVAIGPTADPKLVLRALRGVVDDYLDQSDLERELHSALDRWQHARKKLAETPPAPARVIAVLSPSGGSGCSTIAANVAAILAREHRSALLLDLKLETGDLAALLDLNPPYTLADFGRSLERMDRVLFERTLARHSSGVSLLAPPLSLDDIGWITPDVVRQALAMGRSMFPYVIVDLDRSVRVEQRVVLCQADVILLVMRLDFASLRNVRRTLEHLDRLGIPRERVRIIANRFGQPKEVPSSKAEEALERKIAHFIPDDPKTVNRANNNGVPLVLESPSSKVARSVTRLAISVNGLHSPAHDDK